VIDAVCNVAERIIGKLKEGGAAGGPPLLGAAVGNGPETFPPTPAMKRFADSLIVIGHPIERAQRRAGAPSRLGTGRLGQRLVGCDDVHRVDLPRHRKRGARHRERCPAR
jgi:hypothetical protein